MISTNVTSFRHKHTNTHVSIHEYNALIAQNSVFLSHSNKCRDDKTNSE